MLADVVRRFAMLSPGQRLRWGAVAPAGLFAAVLEGVGGALVFALLTRILDPSPGGSNAVMAFIGARLEGDDQHSTVIRLAACAAAVHIAKNVLLLILATWRTRLVAYDTAATVLTEAGEGGAHTRPHTILRRHVRGRRARMRPARQSARRV
ncbi:MAG: hypothetical protein M3545_15305 [Acidobacteriota bacterium]|nr:hypothetical protein [Acidobacteriota bacterium]